MYCISLWVDVYLGWIEQRDYRTERWETCPFFPRLSCWLLPVLPRTIVSSLKRSRCRLGSMLCMCSAEAVATELLGRHRLGMKFEIWCQRPCTVPIAEILSGKMCAHGSQWISHKINIRQCTQDNEKKWKSWEPFWSYQLNSTAKPAHLPQNWAKLAKSAVLFSW